MDPNLVSAIATSASTVVAAAALIAAFRQVRYLSQQLATDHAWRRREKAFLYSQIHHPEVRAARARLGKALGSGSTRIPWSQFEAAAGKEGATLHQDMQAILIYIENIGLAVRHNVADFGVLYDMNGTDTILFCEMHREYIDTTRLQAGNPRLWRNVDHLARRYADEREARDRASSSRPPAA